MTPTTRNLDHVVTYIDGQFQNLDDSARELLLASIALACAVAANGDEALRCKLIHACVEANLYVSEPLLLPGRLKSVINGVLALQSASATRQRLQNGGAL